MRKWISVACMLCLGVTVRADTFSVTIVLPAGNQATPGEPLPVEIHGLLTNNDPGNGGLCLFSVDFALTGPDTVSLPEALVLDAPSDGSMDQFARPLGFDLAYGGVSVAAEVVQAGGAQNTIGNNPLEPPFVAYPSAEYIDFNIAHSTQVLLAGTITFPASIQEGTYSLAGQNVLANVLAAGQSPAPFGIYAVQEAVPMSVVPVEITVSSTVGDLDGDGDVDAADLAMLLGSWGPCNECQADLNGDGMVAADDLAQLLGHWGP